MQRIISVKLYNRTCGLVEMFQTCMTDMTTDAFTAAAIFSGNSIGLFLVSSPGRRSVTAWSHLWEPHVLWCASDLQLPLSHSLSCTHTHRRTLFPHSQTQPFTTAQFRQLALWLADGAFKSKTWNKSVFKALWPERDFERGSLGGRNAVGMEWWRDCRCRKTQMMLFSQNRFSFELKALLKTRRSL